MLALQEAAEAFLVGSFRRREPVRPTRQARNHYCQRYGPSKAHTWRVRAAL
jgi:hypothetical protein